MNVRKGKIYSLSSLNLSPTDLKSVRRLDPGEAIAIDGFDLEKVGLNKVRILRPNESAVVS